MSCYLGLYTGLLTWFHRHSAGVLGSRGVCTCVFVVGVGAAVINLAARLLTAKEGKEGGDSYSKMGSIFSLIFQ